MSRDLQTNVRTAERTADRVISFTSRELVQSYDRALKDIRAEIVRLFEIYNVEGELTKAQATQFLRQSGLERRITDIMAPYLAENQELLEQVMQVSFDQSYFRHAWAIDQSVGVALSWSGLSDEMVRAAVGLSDDYASLEGLMSAKELRRHRAVVKAAFNNYTADTRRWMGREVSQGVIRGESISKIAGRLKGASLMSQRSAELIARTETLRATGVGAQITYDEAADHGVKVKQVWDATLDDRVRPDHAELDGQEQENGVFQTSAGEIPGPRRSGVASFDINCRCTVRPEIEGYSPQVRRIRGEGIKPYQKFSDWAGSKEITANKYGQKFSFLDR